MNAPLAKPADAETRAMEEQAKGQVSPLPAPVVLGADGGVKVAGGQASDKDTREQDEEKRQKILEQATVWQKWCAVAIAVFTFFQVIVGYWQWDATSKQWASMETQLGLMQLDQRPWFRIEAHPLKELKGGEPFSFDIAVTNVGKSIGTLVGQTTLTVPVMQPGGTPGNGRFENIEGTIMLELDEDVLKTAESSVLDHQFTQIAVPGQTIKYQPGGQHPLIPEVIPLINSEKIIVAVLVAIEYSGPTGTRYRTRSCFIYDAHKKTCFEYLRYGYMK